MWSPCTKCSSSRIPRAGLPVIVSSTWVVRRPAAIFYSSLSPEYETIVSARVRNAHFLPTGPFLCILCGGPVRLHSAHSERRRDDNEPLSPRHARLWSQPAPRQLAGGRPCRRTIRTQLRGRRGEQYSARRRGFGSLSCRRIG